MKAVRLWVCCMLLAALYAMGRPGAALAAEGQSAKDGAGAQVERLVRQLGSDDFRQREEAARKLFDLGPVAIPRLREALKDPDKEIAQRAQGCITEITGMFDLTYLIEVRGYKTLDDFLRAAKDPRPHVRASGVYGLYRFKDDRKKVVPTLLEAMHDEDPLVRSQAISATRFLGDEEKIVAALVEALKDTAVTPFPWEHSVAVRAASCLEVMQPPARAAVPTLIAVIQTDPKKVPDRHLLTMAFRALGNIAGREKAAAPMVVPVLAAVLRGEDLEGRACAASGLAKAGPAASPAVPDLLDAFPVKDVSDANWRYRIRGTVLYAFERIGPQAKAAVPALIEALRGKEEDPRNRPGLARALGSIGPAAESAIPALTEAVEDSDLNVREAATKALEVIRRRRNSALPLNGPGVEALQDRGLLARTLLWTGEVTGANWSAASSWTDGRDATAHVAPQNGDSLIFDVGTSTPDGLLVGSGLNSNNDMANLSVSNLNITSYPATITLANTLTVAGSISMSGGTLAGVGALTVPNGGSTFSWGGGTIAVDVTLGSQNAHPAFNINDAAEKTLSDGTLTSYATTTWTGTGNFQMMGTACFSNKAGAVFDIQTDARISTAAAGPEIMNQGTFKKSLGGGTTTIDAKFTNRNATVQFLSGTVNFTDTAKQTAGTTTLNGGNVQVRSTFTLRGGTLEGIGTITGDLTNTGGTVHPGLGDAAGNLNVVGNCTQTVNGTLVIDFNPTGGNGVLSVAKKPNDPQGNVSGLATLGGTLTVNRNGYKPTGGTFGFMAWASVAGDFASDSNLANDTWTVNTTTYHFMKMKTNSAYMLGVMQ